MIKAVVFDLDDTLIEIKFEGLKKVLEKTNKKLGLDYFTEEEINRLWFKPHRNEFLQQRFKINPENYWKVFNEFYTIKSMYKYYNVYPDIYALTSLSKSKKIGILTSSSPKIGLYKIKLIENVVGKVINNTLFIREHNIPDKPNPIGLELLIKKLGVDKNETILVGDSDCDIETANNAGIPSILIERGHNKNGLIESDPDYVLKNLYQVRCYI
ncbi:MAG: HAD family hydrolase [Candidatus Nanoarchaeia archaeon]|nr:HAD family hydrolase [Candidatus Nanoarchaeia archaeon]